MGPAPLRSAERAWRAPHVARAPSRVAAPPVYIQAPDPLAPAFGAAALGAAAVMLFAGFVLISGILGTRPDIVQWFGKPTLAYPTAKDINLFAIDEASGKLKSIGTSAQVGAPVCLIFVPPAGEK